MTLATVRGTTRRTRLAAIAALLGAGLGGTLFLAGCGDDEGGGPSADDWAFAADAAASYLRVDRMGMPAVATAVITSKDAYNAADPADDAAGDFVPEIQANITALHTALDDDLTTLGLTPCSTGEAVAQAGPFVALMGDVIALDSTQPAGFPNGRRLTDPVIDVTLALVLLDVAEFGAAGPHPVTTFATLPLNPPANDVAFSASFPYLAAPHAP